MNLLLNPQNKKIWFFYLTLINLFWVGMNCPDLSQGFFFLCMLILLGFFVQAREDKIPVSTFTFLIAYLIFHYIALYYYGFIKAFALVKEPLFLLASYKFGHFLGRARLPQWEKNIFLILLAMVSGFVIFAFLSIYLAPNVSMYAPQVVGEAKAGRTGIMIWTGEQGGFGPILGIQGNLGTAFLPVILFGAMYELFKNRKETLFILGVASFFIVCGLYTNVLLKNRGPFVIIAGLFCIISLYNIIFTPSRLTPEKLVKKIIVGLIGVVIVVGMFSHLPKADDLSHLAVVSRFTQEGHSSPRTMFWKNCIKIIAENPMGGRKDYFGHEYAHNIWLDVGYDSGIAAMIFLIIFHFIHFKAMFTLVFGRLPIHPAVISAMIALFCIIFISLFTEPVGKGYTIYYAMTFFYCGLLKRMTADGINLKKEQILNEINHRLRYAGCMPSGLH